MNHRIEFWDYLNLVSHTHLSAAHLISFCSFDCHLLNFSLSPNFDALLNCFADEIKSRKNVSKYKFQKYLTKKEPLPKIFPWMCQVNIADHLYLDQDVVLLLIDNHHIIFDDNSQPIFSLETIPNSINK